MAQHTASTMSIDEGTRIALLGFLLPVVLIGVPGLIVSLYVSGLGGLAVAVMVLGGLLLIGGAIALTLD
jgi:hypothetical protein